MEFCHKDNEREARQMPAISMFYRILVAMFFEDTDRHNLPHIHVR